MRTIHRDLNAVAAFATVVERTSFRGAARALGLPTSTVSLRVRQLEEQLGARLLERTTRSMRLTDAGSSYLQHVTPALEAIRDGERAVAGLQTEPTGLLRLTAPADLAGLDLASIVSEYLALYPSVQVELDLTDRRVNLIEEGYDIALRAGPLDDSALVSRRLGKPQRMLFYASAEYLRRKGRPRRPEDLTRHDCLTMRGHRDATRWHFHERGHTVAVEVRARAAVNSFAVLRDWVMAGRGIARLPDAMVSARTLRTVLDDFALSPRHWHALYSGARNVSAKVRAMIALLDQRLPS